MGKSRRDKGAAARVGDRPFRQVALRAFVQATENGHRVREALAFVAGFDLEERSDTQRFEKQLDETVSEGHFRNPITILRLPLQRAAQVRRFWDGVLGESAVRSGLAADADRRLDDDLVFWFRLDKQAAASGRFRLTDSEDVVLVRAKLATYPKDRETGLSFLRAFFRSDSPVEML